MLNQLMMLIVCILVSLFASVCARPPTLNQDVSWEAWLLVDDQKATPNDQIPRRRITPKSVFVAPTFTPENLPPCAEGYSSDPMGRCIKIIKLDEAKHLEFLVDKLNERFGSAIDYDTMIEFDEEEEKEETREPTKFDIPLSMDFGDYSNDTPQEELDMAIIVTSTSREGNKGGSNKDKRADNKDTLEGNLETWANDKDTLEEELLELKTSTTEQTTTLDITTEPLTTTEETDTETTTGADVTTESTTMPDTTTSSELTTTDIPVTTTTEKVTTTTPKITTYHPIATTYHPFYSKTKNLVKFPQEDTTIPRSHPDGNYIRFPDMKYQQESLVHRTRNVDDQIGSYNELVTQQASNKIQDLLPPPLEQFQYHMATTQRYPLKKSKNQIRWTSGDFKPIVLRFSRKHFNFDANKFKHSEFYRSVPMEDLTYLFGYKNAGQNR